MLDLEHFEIAAQMKKFDTQQEIEDALPCAVDKVPIDSIKSITMSGNSYGFEPCSFLAKQIYSKNAPNLTTINFSNIFVSRLRAELPASLQVMAEALLDK